MIDNDIPTSKSAVLSDLSNLNISNFSFPLIIKPVDSNSSKGVRKVNSEEELNIYFSDTLNNSRAGKVIIEEFVNGQEISVYAFIQNKTTKFIMMSQRYNLSGFIECKGSNFSTIATVTPATISNSVFDKIKNVSDRISHVFNLINTPLHFEVIVSNDEIYVIELSPRMGGGLSFRTIYLNTGFDIINSTVDSFLGLQNELKFHFTNQHYYSTNNVFAEGGVFEKQEGFDYLVDQKIIEEFYLHKTKGMYIEGDLTLKSRVASFIVRAKSEEELLIKTKIAMDNIRIIDREGRDFTRKNLYLDRA
jgi:biotin carboxylase